MANHKQINIYIRQHPFLLSSIQRFTTSQRRAFLRDVYDYSRALGLGRKDARQQTIKARQMCGEDDYDSDHSALENEIDDSKEILEKLRGSPIPATTIIANPFVNTTTSHQSSTNGENRNSTITGQRVTNGTRSTTALTLRSSQQSLTNSQKPKRSASEIAQDSKTAELLKGTGIESPLETASISRKRHQRRPTKGPADTVSKAVKDQKVVYSSSKSLHNKNPSAGPTGQSPRSELIQSIELEPTTNHVNGPVNAIVPSDVPATPATIVNQEEAGTIQPKSFAAPDVATFSDDE